MNIKKIKIESVTGHFGQVLGYDDRFTYEMPPPSTVIGILRVLFGDDIDNFKFGYLFESETKFIDDILIHKRKHDGNRFKKGINFVSDVRSMECLYNCGLIIYTDINRELVVNYILSMGRSNNPAKLVFPIKEIELIDKDGFGFNQYTPEDIGRGRIFFVNMLSRFNSAYDSYDNQIAHLRFNEKFKYNKTFDPEEKQNIFIWQLADGVVKPFYD